MADLSISASMDSEGTVHVTAANLDADRRLEIELEALGMRVNSAAGRILAGDMGAFNDFDHPKDVGPAVLEDIAAAGGRVRFMLPGCSVAEITVR